MEGKPKKPHVMIVDDDEDFATAAARVLQDAGCETQIELSTHGAIAGIRQRRPDLVILDVMFPEDSCAGFDLARSIRNLGAEIGNIPILMLTAVNSRFPLGFGARDIDDRWLPVNDFPEKPVDLGALRARVLRLLGKPASSAADA